MFGWSAVEIPMLVVLPALLVASAFFSGSETAMFGLSAPDRIAIRRERPRLGRIIDQLLVHERMLLITILVGNMTVNVLYFVITSVLLMKADVGVVGGVLLALAFLVLVIIVGEVSPKLLANSLRTSSYADGSVLLPTVVGFVGPMLLTVHRILGPLRIFLDVVVVAPLSRLTAPRTTPPRLDHEELAALVQTSQQAGVIDSAEQQILQDVIAMSGQKVRSVMTPRVRVIAVRSTARRGDVVKLIRRHRFTSLPVYGRDLDDIVGVLPVKGYLLGPPDVAVASAVRPVQFVPEMATLDQVLAHFRQRRTELAIVVDEFGGTAGIVTLEDVVEEIVGDIASSLERSEAEPVLIAPGRWRVSGDLAVRDWAEAFGQGRIAHEVSTIGGLIVAHLGRQPSPGDGISVGNVRLEVERVERSRVESVLVTLVENGGPPEDRAE